MLEITQLLDIHKQKQEEEAKTMAINTYNNAYLISMFIGCSFNNKEIPSIEELFPQLFKSPIVQQNQDNEKLQTLFVRDQLKEFARQANLQRNGGNKNK